MKKIFLLCLPFFICMSGYGQTSPDSVKTAPETVVAPAAPQKVRKDMRPMKERIDIGFGTSFWITPNQTYVEIAPVLAYLFPKALVTGAGYRYIYRHSRIYGRDLNAYGPNFFARLSVTRRIYLWTEYEILQNEYFTQETGQELTTNTTTTHSFFGGLGYIKSLGKRGRGGLSFQILYNFLYESDDYSPYYAPVTYRVGYFF